MRAFLTNLHSLVNNGSTFTLYNNEKAKSNYKKTDLNKKNKKAKNLPVIESLRQLCEWGIM